MTRVAADALGLPLQRVRFSLGDSTFPRAPSHSGSRTMASVGSAVFVASNSLRDRLIRTAVVDPASPLNGAAPQNVIAADGRMYRTDDPSRGETYQDLLRRRGRPSVDTVQTWTATRERTMKRGSPQPRRHRAVGANARLRAHFVALGAPEDTT
jgi:xanthine dehydrogenase YagR molybdenum-binding subunit